ncbi:MAG: ImmA/IrrE family metallo-endopeptidase [Ignavibacteria bacterium]|nr:ImmA/IrrE family metallo-endopeptidase [Ignavibacteria bacterium]
MSTAFVNHNIIEWARIRSGKSIDELAAKLSPKYIEWERGEAKPTFRQIEGIAKKLHIPIGYLFLSEPPAEAELTVDLRSFKDSLKKEFSLELQDVIADAIKKQDWYRDYVKELGAEPLNFIGKFNLNSPIKQVALDIQKTLKISLEDRLDLNKEGFLKYLTLHAEEAGILVIKNGKVATNPYRKLSVDEFRGFALNDSYAPIIFINNADFIASKIFTFAHELAHLWIGSEGVTNLSFADDINHLDVEEYCNKVAAEVLVPEINFKMEWKKYSGNLHLRSKELEKTFKVSSIVIARRALDVGMIEREEFFEYYKLTKQKWLKKEKNRSGGDFLKSFPIINSRTFTNAVCKAVFSEKLMMRTGARMLGVQPETLFKYAKREGLL